MQNRVPCALKYQPIAKDFEQRSSDPFEGSTFMSSYCLEPHMKGISEATSWRSAMLSPPGRRRLSEHVATTIEDHPYRPNRSRIVLDSDLVHRQSARESSSGREATDVCKTMPCAAVLEAEKTVTIKNNAATGHRIRPVPRFESLTCMMGIVMSSRAKKPAGSKVQYAKLNTQEVPERRPLGL